MGPSRRRGPAKLKGQKMRSKRIENALSEAMTGDNPTDKMYRERSFADKIIEKLQDMNDASVKEYIEERPVQKKRYGGKVRAMKCGGAVMSGRGPKFKGSN